MCSDELLGRRQALSGDGKQLVRDVLVDDERGDGFALEARAERVPERRAADQKHTDRPFLVRVLDGAAAVRCGGTGDEGDLPAHVRAGEVVHAPTTCCAADHGDSRFGCASTRAAAHRFGEVNTRAIGLPA